MTRQELTDFLGGNFFVRVYEGIRIARDVYPALRTRERHDGVEPNFTRDEIRLICICMGMNLIQQEIVQDNWDKCSKEKNLLWVRTRSQYIDGNDEFVDRIKKGSRVKACGNCMFCSGKTIKTQSIKLHPFCEFYNKFINKMEVEKNGKIVRPDIFKDRCDSWRKSEPHLFLRD